MIPAHAPPDSTSNCAMKMIEKNGDSQELLPITNLIVNNSIIKGTITNRIGNKNIKKM